jgi:hypothetical protein
MEVSVMWAANLFTLLVGVLVGFAAGFLFGGDAMRARLLRQLREQRREYGTNVLGERVN